LGQAVVTDLRIPALQAIGLLLVALAVTWHESSWLIRGGVLFMVASVALYGFVDPAGWIYRRRTRGE
jgi:hypothetical protein